MKADGGGVKSWRWWKKIFFYKDETFFLYKNLYLIGSQESRVCLRVRVRVY